MRAAGRLVELDAILDPVFRSGAARDEAPAVRRVAGEIAAELRVGRVARPFGRVEHFAVRSAPNLLAVAASRPAGGSLGHPADVRRGHFGLAHLDPRRLARRDDGGLCGQDDARLGERLGLGRLPRRRRLGTRPGGPRLLRGLRIGDEVDDQRSLAALRQLRDDADAEQDEQQQQVEAERERDARRAAMQRRLVERRAEAIGRGQRVQS